MLQLLAVVFYGTREKRERAFVCTGHGFVSRVSALNCSRQSAVCQPQRTNDRRAAARTFECARAGGAKEHGASSSSSGAKSSSSRSSGCAVKLEHDTLSTADYTVLLLSHPPVHTASRTTAPVSCVRIHLVRRRRYRQPVEWCISQFVHSSGSGRHRSQKRAMQPATQWYTVLTRATCH